MEINSKVMELLQKVLRLANDKAATQGEIEAAMAKAKQIAIANGIELASVQITDPNTKSVSVDVQSDDGLKLGVAFIRKYHTWVFHVCQEVFGVRFITNRYRQGSRERCNHIWIIGEVTDVAIAKAVFSWLERLYPQSYHEAIRTFKIPEDNAASAHGFYRGLTTGILERNKKEEEQVRASADGNKWALVVRSKETAIEQRMNEMFPGMRQRRARSVRQNFVAAAVGYERGKQINLNQIGGGRATGRPQTS